jgi:hypothetical protein
MRAERARWRRPLPLLCLMVAVPVLGLAGATALGGEDSFATRDFIVGVSDEVAAAHDPKTGSRHELPWLLAGDTDLAVAPDGHRLAFVSGRDGGSEIFVVDTQVGVLRRLTSGPRTSEADPTWSPDGQRLAWERTAGASSSIVVARADGTGREHVIATGGRNADPAWAPKGDGIVFASNRDDSHGLWLASAAGLSLEPLVTLESEIHAPAWSPHGDVIAFETRGDLWRVDLASGVTRPILRGGAADTEPAWAPDAGRLVFVRAGAGRRTLQTIAAGGGRPRPVAGSSAETDPQWTMLSPLLVPPEGARLPDLDQRPPTDLTIVSLGGRWALGFTSAVENLGRGPLLIRGMRRQGAVTMRADQVIEFGDGRKLTVPRIGRLRYEPHPPHFHWHLQPFEAYTLRSVANPNVVVRDRKSGFCLVDRYGNAVLPAPKIAPPRFTSNCATGRPGARTVVEGSSPGYRDRYPAFFHGQDVDVTGLPAGLFVLAHQANPLRAAREARYTNDAASVLLRLTWPDGQAEKPMVEVLRSCETTATCRP